MENKKVCPPFVPCVHRARQPFSHSEVVELPRRALLKQRRDAGDKLLLWTGDLDRTLSAGKPLQLLDARR